MSESSGGTGCDPAPGRGPLTRPGVEAIALCSVHVACSEAPPALRPPCGPGSPDPPGLHPVRSSGRPGGAAAAASVSRPPAMLRLRGHDRARRLGVSAHSARAAPAAPGRPRGIHGRIHHALRGRAGLSGRLGRPPRMAGDRPRGVQSRRVRPAASEAPSASPDLTGTPLRRSTREGCSPPSGRPRPRTPDRSRAPGSRAREPR